VTAVTKPLGLGPPNAVGAWCPHISGKKLGNTRRAGLSSTNLAFVFRVRRTFLLFVAVRRSTEKLIIRIGTGLCAVFAISTLRWIPEPKNLPGVALGASAAYRLEVTFIFFIASYAALTVLVRGVLRAQCRQQSPVRA